MSVLRKIPYGVSNYDKLVHGCHYVDKTAYIRRLEEVETPVFLRPRRFGKSLLCSMLEYYYDINQKERFDELFGNTDIGRTPTPLANSFLVLNLDFSPIQVGKLEEIEDSFVKKIRCDIEKFVAKYKASADWSKVLKATTAVDMMNGLCEIILQNHLPPLYVIIDEYDNFANELVVSNRDMEYNALCGHDNTGLNRESFLKVFFKAIKAGLKEGSVGRTYFTGVLPITLDDLSSGFNVGTIVSLDSDFLSMVGFTQAEVEKYVDEIFREHGFDEATKELVLMELKALYDGYHFLPEAEPLYNATICNWYLAKLVANDGKLPTDVYDSNLNADIGWFRRLAGGASNALKKVEAYVGAGTGEACSRGGLSSKFGRTRFFTEDFYPYALYYLGLMTFGSPFRLVLPNLTVKTMFVRYYDELLNFKNENTAQQLFLKAAESLVGGSGTWQELFRQYWEQFVKARIPAQAYDQMNENFFRTTFISRCMDALVPYYSFESEYNNSGGRADFLAVPRPGNPLHAQLIEFKYVKVSGRGRTLPRETRSPDPEAVAQARAYGEGLAKRPGWNHVLDIAVVTVFGSRGFRWRDVGNDKEDGGAGK